MYSFNGAIGNVTQYELTLTDIQNPLNIITDIVYLSEITNTRISHVVSNITPGTSYTFSLKPIYDTGNTYIYTTTFTI